MRTPVRSAPFALGLALALTLATTPGAAAAPPPTGGVWVLVGNPYRSPIELTWSPEFGTVVVHVGCQETTYAVVPTGDDHLALEDGLTHEGACFHQEGRQPQVRAYWASVLKQIEATTSATTDGDRLRLSTGRGRSLLLRRTPPSDRP